MSALLSTALEALVIDTDALARMHPKADLDRLPIWELWRQDDNGNRFRMKRLRCYAAAVQIAESFEARGHKQTYWVEEPPGPNHTV